MQINASSKAVEPTFARQQPIHTAETVYEPQQTPPLNTNLSIQDIPELSQSYPAPQVALSVSLDSRLSTAQQHELQALQQCFPDLAVTLDSLSQGESPILLKTDAQGRTILSQLTELSQAKGVYPEVSTQAVTKQLISRLQDRSEIFQGPQYSCGSAAIQNYMTANDPAEMVSVVKDLATQGKARLRDGSAIKLPADTRAYLKNQSTYLFNHGKDHDKRDVSDVLFQSAVMKDISLVGGDRAWKGKSDNLLEKGLKAFKWLTDWADYNAKNDDVGLMSKLKGDGGGDPFLIEPMIEAMTGKAFDSDSLLKPDNLWGKKSAYLDAIATVKRGENERLTLLKSPLHYVVLTDFDSQNQTVTYLSTGTYHKDSGESSSTEYKTVPLADFLKNCGALYGPQ